MSTAQQEASNVLSAEQDATLDTLLAQARSLEHSAPAEARAIAQRAAALAEASGLLVRQAEALHTLGSLATNDSSFSEALDHYKKALHLYDSENDTQGAAQTAGELGTVHFFQGQYSPALAYARRSLALHSELGNTQGEAMENSRLGTLMQHLGNLPQALEYLLRAFELYQSLDEHSGLAACLNNLALVYKDLKQYDQALEYNRQSLEICRLFDSRGGEAGVYCNMGVIYSEKGMNTEALQHFRKALELARQAKDLHRETIALTNLGSILGDLQEYSRSIATYKECLRIAQKARFRRSEAYAWIGLGRCYCHQGQFAESADAIAKARQYVDESGVLALQSEFYHATMELYEKQGKSTTALDYCRRYHAVELERINKRSNEKLNNLQILHETEQARKEAEIQRLENVELAAANDRLEQLIRAKNEFLGMAAHDLKNPLSNVRGLARLVKTQSAELRAAEVSEFCGDIEACADRILKLVGDLLDINRIDQGRLKVKAAVFDVSQTTERYLSVYSECAQRKNIRLGYDGQSSEVMAFADRDIMIQVLDNLVSNALKFSPPDTEVTVTVRSTNCDQSKWARIEVRDEGPGINADEMPRLFGKFTRLSARPTGGEESTGLGLSIVKQLIEAMRGRVWCESFPGEGAMFIVELPAEPY